nr:MAG TPA: hypothetical protein [Caudoviricetes sp.]
MHSLYQGKLFEIHMQSGQDSQLKFSLMRRVASIPH